MAIRKPACSTAPCTTPNVSLSHSTPTCVQDLADLLETCCEDVSKARGATDPFLSSGEHRLNRLLQLWGDSRSRVRACAVRSLLALAQGIVG